MSGCRMQTTDIDTRHRDGGPLERVVKHVSIGNLVDHLNRALINFELLGSGVGAIMISSVLLLMALVQQATHCGAEKGAV